MPKVGNKEYSYDEAGMEEAKKEAAKTGEAIDYKGYADGGVVNAQDRSKKVEGYYGGGMVNPANRMATPVGAPGIPNTPQVGPGPTPRQNPRIPRNRQGFNKGGKVGGCK